MKTLKKHKALLLCFMSLFFMAGMCEEDPYVENVLVQGIELNYSDVELGVGNELTLTATVTPGDATTKSLSWKSHNDRVAIVDAIDEGMAVVTAVSPGTTIITATAKDGSGETATCVVTVVANNSGDPETQWSEWEFVNTGTYTYTLLLNGEDSERPVYTRRSLVDDAQQQFKVENVLNGVDLIIDYDRTTGLCHVGEGYTGYDHEDGSIYVSDVNTYTGTNDYPSYYNEEAGLFELYLIYYIPELGYFDYGWEYLQLDGYTQPDYSIMIEHIGNTENTASFYFTKGSDVAFYRYAIVAGTLSQEDAYNMAWEIIDGTIAYNEAEESGYHDFRLTEEGEYNVVAVSFDETGTPKRYSWYSFELSTSPWQSLGMATYREDLMTTFYNIDNLVYDVEIEASTETPGLYRLVNPYGAAYPYNEEGDYDTSENHYMVIDAQNPEAVTIQQTYTGMNWGYGEVFVWSLAEYLLNNGSTAEEIAASGYFGKFENGVITFPTKTLLISMPELENGGLYYSNLNGQFAVALPGYSIPGYYAPALAPAQRATKQIDKKIITPDSPSLKRHFTNTGRITKYKKSISLDAARL